MQKVDISAPTRIMVYFFPGALGKFTVSRQNGRGEIVPNYFRNFDKPRRNLCFNLYQIGVYFFPDNCQVFRLPVRKGKIITLPTPDRNLRTPSLKEFTFEDLSNDDLASPARVFHDEKIIQTNATFRALPEQVQDAILLHELGHFSYSTEYGADAYACSALSKMNGNISQMFYALELACKHNDLNERRKAILKTYQNYG